MRGSDKRRGHPLAGRAGRGRRLDHQALSVGGGLGVLLTQLVGQRRYPERDIDHCDVADRGDRARGRRWGGGGSRARGVVIDRRCHCARRVGGGLFGRRIADGGDVHRANERQVKCHLDHEEHDAEKPCRDPHRRHRAPRMIPPAFAICRQPSTPRAMAITPSTGPAPKQTSPSTPTNSAHIA